MSEMGDIILHCQDLNGMDRLVLWGWVDQLDEGSDLAYAAKETVGKRIGVSEDTVKRHTHILLKAGWMVDTGERKQWSPDKWTRIYRVDFEKLLESEMDRGCKMHPGANGSGVQDAPQGSDFDFGSGSSSCYGLSFDLNTTTTSGLRPLVIVDKSPPKVKGEAKPKTENPEPTPTPKPSRLCPKFGMAWSRNQNHVCLEEDVEDFMAKEITGSMARFREEEGL